MRMYSCGFTIGDNGIYHCVQNGGSFEEAFRGLMEHINLVRENRNTDKFEILWIYNISYKDKLRE